MITRYEDLVLALKREFGDKINEKPVEDIAIYVLNFFGYSERIIDNCLQCEDRDFFYTLEDSGFLTTEREENTLLNGREWRTPYWIINKDKIYKPVDIKEKAIDIYSELSDDVWLRKEEAQAIA